MTAGRPRKDGPRNKDGHLKAPPSKNPNGRPPTPVRFAGLPPKEVNLDQILYWMELQATAEEIAGSFYISTVTLDEILHKNFGVGFLELKKRVSGSAHLSIRRIQYKLAQTNTTMAIWLGKQWLGQKDDPSAHNERTNQLVQTLLDHIMEIKKTTESSDKDSYQALSDCGERPPTKEPCPSTTDPID